MKNHYIGGNCLKKEGAWIVCRFKKGLGKKEGVVFLKGGGGCLFWGGGGGVDNPNANYDSSSYKNSITWISHCNTFHFLRYMHIRYAKCLFINIHKQ